MIIRTGVMILVAAFVCCSTQAQSLLLDKGEYGWYFQGGYVGGENSIVSGGEFDLGFAPCSRFDLGVGLSVAKIRYSYNYSWWSNTFEESRTTVGPVLNAYPLKLGGKGAAIAVGIHEAASFRTGSSGENSNAVGTTLNLFAYTGARSGIVFSGGYFAIATRGVADLNNSAMIGLNPFVKTKGGCPVSFVFQYNINEGPDTFVVGISLGTAMARAKA